MCERIPSICLTPPRYLSQVKYSDVEVRLREAELANATLVAAAAAVSAEDLIQERSLREKYEQVRNSMVGRCQ